MLEFVLNFLFPPVCGICGKIEKNWICEKCKKRIKSFEKYEHIVVNKKINSDFENEINNKELKIFYDEILYCFEYKGIIRKLLLGYKFSDKSYLSNLFANIMLNNKKINEIFKIYDIIIPVPMDKIKKLKRGYNQTELITNIISKKTNILENYTCLAKIKITKTQSTLSLEQRKENIKNAFSIIDSKELKNKNVILFDDIYTTGATANEIAKILKQAGVRKILVLVIAKD